MPLPPGTPASIEPPALPLHFAHPAPIEWKKFLRSALPLCLLAGISIIVYAPLGLLVFIACVMVAVSRYRRNYSGALTATQGAKLGAVAGVLSFVLPLIVVIIVMVRQSAEYRQQVAVMFQQRLGPTPDPQAVQVAQWFSSPQGFVFGAAFTILFLLAIAAIISSLAGAVSAAGFARRRR
jgi:ABC-type multidrug transport system fused ATPase/permease subunit